MRKIAQGLVNSQTARLAHLELDAAGVTPACLPDLAGIAGLANLSILGNELGDAALPPLALMLCGSPAATGAGDGAPAADAAGRPFRDLRSLNISGNGFSAAAATDLLGSLRLGCDEVCLLWCCLRLGLLRSDADVRMLECTVEANACLWFAGPRESRRAADRRQPVLR